MSTTEHRLPRAEWPEQAFLPGQAAAPEGPVDMSVMYFMHRGFRGDLDRFVDAARHTPVTDRATWQRLAARWGTFAEILHHHHHGEDTHLWPWLLQRASAEDVETLEAMEAEHDGIQPLLTGSGEGFGHLAEHADDDVRAALVVRLTALREALGRHLAHEESDAMAILQQLMTPEEFHELDEEAWRKPLTPRLAWALVPWMGQNLDAATRARALASAPLPFRLVWHASHRGFARRERATFAYCTGA